MGWSSSAVGHYRRESLVALAYRVHEIASRSFIPTLFREMMMIVFLAISHSSI